ncbi:MAG: HNH endonuclease signature motif containing protein [Oligoflexia bacterium]|nr:HNH endonuclease signature motif containing protein [Oligoflexia bacterium]
MNLDSIHLRTVEISTRYKKTEAELIQVLQQAEEHRVFLVRGHASMLAYVTAELGLSESTAYALIQAGAITLSNARRVVSVLTPENQSEWIRKASELSSRELEKEIVKVRPQEAVQERTSYVTEDRVRLELGLSESELVRLRRVQDLLCQSRGRVVSLEEAIQAMTAEYLDRHDPLEKAKRAKKSTVTVDQLVTRRVRTPIPAAVLHQVNLRDQRKCAYVLHGKRCNQTRWIEIHHKNPVSHGGLNEVDNLITLCSAHHKRMHLESQVSCGSDPRCERIYANGVV